MGWPPLLFPTDALLYIQSNTSPEHSIRTQPFMKHFERGRHSRGRNKKSVGSKSWNGKKQSNLSLFVKIGQIFILFQFPCQNWPDFNTFSVSLPNFARFSYFFSLPVKIGQIFILFQSSWSKLAKFSYFCSLLVKISQIFILYQSPFQFSPDFHTFSVSLPNFARFSYFFSLPVKIRQIFILFQSPF